MARIALLLLAFVGCSGRAPENQRSTVPSRTPVLASSEPSQWSWFVEPESSDLVASVELSSQGRAEVVVAASPGGDERRLVANVDAGAFRGRRALLELFAKVDSQPGALGSALVRISVRRGAARPGYWDRATSSSVRTPEWTRTAVALEVPNDADALRVEVVARGGGVARFRDIALTGLPAGRTESVVLRDVDYTRFEILARLAGYLRFFHPSDQSAQLDWSMYLVEAVERVLRARDDAEFRAVLEWLTSVTAPTATVYASGQTPNVAAPPRGQFLTRWHHLGFGPNSPYATFRAGLGEPEHVGVTLWKNVSIDKVVGCATVVANAVWESTGDAAIPVLGLRPLSGLFGEQTSTTSRLEMAVPDGTTAVALGVGMRGHGTVGIREVTLSCGKQIITRWIASDESSQTGAARYLYEINRSASCGGKRCVRFTRVRQNQWIDERDLADVALGGGLRLRFPLAVWTEEGKTLPITVKQELARVSTLPEISVRISTVLETWLALHWFYPYFADLGIQWDGVLRPALQQAAAASNADLMQRVMEGVSAALRDNHAAALRIGFDAGVTPVVMRRFDSALYVVNGVSPFADMFPRGATVQSIDGIPAAHALKIAKSRISAATEGWSDQSLSTYLGYGQRGEIVPFVLRLLDGSERQVAVPRLDLPRFVDRLREPRPASGTEIAPQTIYVDLENMTADDWDRLVPKVRAASSVLFDMRGDITNQAFDAIAHFTTSEVKTPFMDIPVVTADRRATYERNEWSLFPRLPGIAARAFFLVDGRAASTHETVLQMVKHSRLGTLVGEQTAGTNGNVTWFKAGGFAVMFTGMRVLNRDGSRLHGVGITPDIAVHPTVQGIQAGRDEILEAAIRAATSRANSGAAGVPAGGASSWVR